MITPRATRLVRTASLTGFRRALIALAYEGTGLVTRDRLVALPTHAAGALLVATVERERLTEAGALVHPTYITARELPARLSERAVPTSMPSRPEAREILMGVACRRAIDAGAVPPFALRPGLIAEVLRFYESLLRHRRDIATFERLALGRLEPGAEYDRGAERLVRQTRFLVAAFTQFEALSVERGLLDDAALRRVAIEVAASEPWRHVIVAVGDESRDRFGLCAADWDVLTRVPGLERLDVLVTDRMLAGAWHEHVHQLLPGIEEVRFEHHGEATRPVMCVPRDASNSVDPRSGSDTARAWMARDREDELESFARWVRRLDRDGRLVSERVALVVNKPLPYLYLAREVLRSANIACQTFDTSPLAAEPCAAALDLVFSAVSTSVSRAAGAALLESPQFNWRIEGERLSRPAIAAADAFLSEHGFLGGIESLERLTERAQADRVTAVAALQVLLSIARELHVLGSEAPAHQHLDVLLGFMARHGAEAPADDVGSRWRRAHAAINGILTVLRDEYRELESEPVAFEQVVAVIRRWVEAHTFALRSDDIGVHVVDADSARFGDFDHVQLAGLIDGQWPAAPTRNIFYGASLLRDLGWAPDAQRIEHARASFGDLLELPSHTVIVSTFGLDDETMVSPSSLLDELSRWSGDVEEAALDWHPRIFESEVMTLEPQLLDTLGVQTKQAAQMRLSLPPPEDLRFHGSTTGYQARAYSLSALERYQDCPFRYFAADVLRLAEIPEDEAFLSPRARGRFIHEVFQRFFERWDEQDTKTITVDNMGAARALFADVASPLLAALNESDAALEHARLFGSAVAPGMIDVVLGLEASRPETVVERWLERSFDDRFDFGSSGTPPVPIRGIADRIDLLEGRRLRVIDYKTGRAPDVNRALQVPVYALCAQQDLRKREGQAWDIAEASYVAFTGRRSLVPVVGAGEDAEPVLASARERLTAAVDGINRGTFAPRPHDTTLCRTCAYPSVCRKDYVDAQS